MLIFPAGLLQGCLLNEYEKLSDATYIDSYPLSSSPEAEAQALARRMFFSLPITSLSIHKPRTRLTFFPSQQNDENKVLEYSHGLEGKKCQLQTLFHLPHEIHISKCRKMTRHLLFEWKNQPAGRTKSLQHWDTGSRWMEGGSTSSTWLQSWSWHLPRLPVVHPASASVLQTAGGQIKCWALSSDVLGNTE